MEWRVACAYSKDKMAYNIIDKEHRFILYAEIGKPPAILMPFGEKSKIDLSILPDFGWMPVLNSITLN